MPASLATPLLLATLADGVVPRSLWYVLSVEAGIILALVLLIRIPLTYNIQNLIVRWKTTLMTALAFTLVVSLLIVMQAFVNGMSVLTAKSGQPGNVVILAEGATDESFSSLNPDELGDIERQSGVVRNAAGLPLASRETYMLVNQGILNPRPGGPNRRFLQLRGVEDPALAGEVHRLALKPGGAWFSEAGVRANPDGGTPLVEAVIGSGLAIELGKDSSAEGAPPRPLDVGDTLTLNDRPWLVVGVLDAAGTTFDSEIWAKRGLVGPMFGKDDCSSLVVRAADVALGAPPEQIAAATAASEKLADFFVNKDGVGYSKAKLSAMTELKYFEGLSGTSQAFAFAAWGVTAILAIGGVFGVLNTMFAAVSQRTRDIGVLRLLGYPRLQILLSFLLEAVMIAFVGGVLGCLLGLLADGWTATSIVGGGGGRRQNDRPRNNRQRSHAARRTAAVGRGGIRRRALALAQRDAADRARITQVSGRLPGRTIRPPGRTAAGGRPYFPQTP